LEIGKIEMQLNNYGRGSSNPINYPEYVESLEYLRE